MKTFSLPAWMLVICVFLSGCSFVAGQLKDKADEERLLKPGALDPVINPSYERYSYKMLGRYNVSHDWPTATSPCHYHGPKNGQQGDIYEFDGSTLQAGVLGPKPQNIDRYVRSNKQMAPIRKSEIDRWGTRYIDASKPPIGYKETETGLRPICGQVLERSSHSISISLIKFPLDVAIRRYTEPNVSTNKETVGENTWITQISDIKPREINTYGGAYLAWLLPVGDTGYTFVFKLGANQDSLKHPEAHARMQEIFRHLVESVKIEPLPANPSNQPPSPRGQVLQDNIPG